MLKVRAGLTSVMSWWVCFFICCGSHSHVLWWSSCVLFASLWSTSPPWPAVHAHTTTHWRAETVLFWWWKIWWNLFCSFHLTLMNVNCHSVCEGFATASSPTSSMPRPYPRQTTPIFGFPKMIWCSHEKVHVCTWVFMIERRLVRFVKRVEFTLHPLCRCFWVYSACRGVLLCFNHWKASNRKTELAHG